MENEKPKGNGCLLYTSSMLAGSLNGIVGGLAVALQGIVDKQDETAA